MAKSKDKPAYDANGRWVEERGRIKGAIRRVFRQSPQMREVLEAARVELPPKTLKNGSLGKKNQVRYRCACCGELFPSKWVQVDHIKPVVPLYRKEVDMSYDELARGIMCATSNLQVICSTPKKITKVDSCHGKKTNEENFVRDKLTGGDWLYAGHLKVDIDGKIAEAKGQYQTYLEEKRKEAESKLQRKLAREAKRRGKANVQKSGS